MNIYLDIDGVLVDRNGNLADFAEVFLQYILTYWPDSTYWLTSYCWRGDNRATDFITPLLKKKRSIELIGLVKPTDWNRLKTDAIDFKQPFLWFDDNLAPEEAEILNHYHAAECHRCINLIRDPSQLLTESIYIKSLV